MVRTKIKPGITSIVFYSLKYRFFSGMHVLDVDFELSLPGCSNIAKVAGKRAQLAMNCVHMSLIRDEIKR